MTSSLTADIEAKAALNRATENSPAKPITLDMMSAELRKMIYNHLFSPPDNDSLLPPGLPSGLTVFVDIDLPDLLAFPTDFLVTLSADRDPHNVSAETRKVIRKGFWQDKGEELEGHLRAHRAWLQQILAFAQYSRTVRSEFLYEFFTKRCFYISDDDARFTKLRKFINTIDEASVRCLRNIIVETESPTRRPWSYKGEDTTVYYFHEMPWQSDGRVVQAARNILRGLGFLIGALDSAFRLEVRMSWWEGSSRGPQLAYMIRFVDGRARILAPRRDGSVGWVQGWDGTQMR